ncbi:phosphoglucomutase (alpha-D-glucose-1,6-bisphosphate-dependent) [Agrococcus casei]|uniref:phosphoglucomutase (alpha-D-glucose-1,6-bisphosphate-dependent) n=1 Tax=Agrococcus casei TaxID=343512 RepID=UPI003F8F1727
MTRAGQVAEPQDLIDVDALIAAYSDLHPAPSVPAQRVAFGTSGHRGSSLDTSFNDDHIAAITQAICEYRASIGIAGPLFIGRDTHALSGPAHDTALEVLVANDIRVIIDSRDSWVPTPALSRAIVAYNSFERGDQADGIVITPSHNPPRDGGFKYNPPHGGPADSDATKWIADRANEIIADGLHDVLRRPVEEEDLEATDYREHYVAALEHIIDFRAIRESGIRLGADPLGGAAVEYYELIAERYGIDLTVVNDKVDPQWAFMTLDWDEKIRMDCSSRFAMASALRHQSEFDILTGNDADADRHGIVTRDGGLMNPNHFLAVAIYYLFTHRPEWGYETAIGKTLVSSSMIDRVAEALGRELVEVPVGFKWFVDGLSSGTIGFGGEESAGASFLTRDGSVWTTDKDGIVLALLAGEILAATGKTPSEIYSELADRYGAPVYERVDAVATKEQKSKLSKLSAADVTATELAGDPITAKLTEAPGNGAAIGGLKVTTDRAWFAARPSGTEDVYKIYAESFVGAEHLREVQAAAREIVNAAIG